MTDKIPQEHKDKADAHYSRAKEFLSEEYFPPERRDQFVYRGKKVVIECQGHKDYQESVQWLLGFLEEYAGHGKTMAGQSQSVLFISSYTRLMLRRTRSERRARRGNIRWEHAAGDVRAAHAAGAFREWDEPRRYWGRDAGAVCGRAAGRRAQGLVPRVRSLCAQGARFLDASSS